MTSPDAATRHVVDRCPSCGVEHDVRVDECEACGSALRAWCRRHSRDTGWLDTPSCARCVEDAARAARPAIAPVRPPAPAHAAGSALAAVRRGADGVRMSDAAERPAAPWQPNLASYAASLILMLLLGVIGGGGAALIFVLPIVVLLGGDLLVMAPGLALAGAIAGALSGLYGFADYVQKVRAKAAERESSAPSSGSSP